MDENLLPRLRGCTVEHLEALSPADRVKVQFASFEELEQIIFDYAAELGSDKGWGSEGIGALREELLKDIADLAGLNDWPESC